MFTCLAIESPPVNTGLFLTVVSNCYFDQKVTVSRRREKKERKGLSCHFGSMETGIAYLLLMVMFFLSDQSFLWLFLLKKAFKLSSLFLFFSLKKYKFALVVQVI